MKSIKPFTFSLLAILFTVSATLTAQSALAGANDSIAINGNKEASDYPVLNPSKTDLAINIDGGDEEARELYGYQGDTKKPGEDRVSAATGKVLQTNSVSGSLTLEQADRHIRNELASLKLQLDALKKELKDIDEMRSDILGLKKVALMHAQGIDDNSRDIDYQLRTLKNLGSDVASSKTDFDVISKQIENRMERKTSELYDTNSLLNLKVEASADELKNLKILTYSLIFVIALIFGLMFVLFKLSRQVSKLKKNQEKRIKTITFAEHSPAQGDDKNDSGSIPQEEETKQQTDKSGSEKPKKKKDSDRPSPKPFHSLVLRISDDIAKMETQLFSLEKDSEDYTALNRAIERKKKIAADNGYTISGYSGIEYRIDMPYEAEFIKDTSLAEGKAIVCGMLKMQVEYKGQIVQQAKLLVRENY